MKAVGESKGVLCVSAVDMVGSRRRGSGVGIVDRGSWVLLVVCQQVASREINSQRTGKRAGSLRYQLHS